MNPLMTVNSSSKWYCGFRKLVNRILTHENVKLYSFYWLYVNMDMYSLIYFVPQWLVCELIVEKCQRTYWKRSHETSFNWKKWWYFGIMFRHVLKKCKLWVFAMNIVLLSPASESFWWNHAIENIILNNFGSICGS